MKTSMRKLRGFALTKQGAKERKDLQPLAQLDELAQASQDLHDMRDCYDSLLSTAAATANSSYEYSESLRELGDCLLEKTALNDDEESGKVLLMLGKVQYRLQKLIDGYRSHINQTITIPSESLLNELRIVEEMKNQCDEKREVYEYMKTRQREKGRLRSGKGESFSLQQLQMARDEYDEEATLFVFRLKSLKQGQSRSLLTQAARHHAAQMCFFRKALQSLEAVEPHVKLVTERQHIDYQFGGLEDDDLDDDDYDYEDNDDDDSYDENDDGELSFDYGQNGQEQDVSFSQNSMEVDQVDLTFPKVTKVEDVKQNLERLYQSSVLLRARAGSQSAPLFAENQGDPAEKLRQIRPSFTRKFHSYVLPTPIDTKGSVSKGSGSPVNHTTQTGLSERTQNLWHSSPLELKKYERIIEDEKGSKPTLANLSVLKESNNNAASTPLPPRLSDGLYSRHDQAASDSKKIKRQAFSGPLTSKPWANKPVGSQHPQLFSGPILRNPLPQHPSSSPPKTSPGASPTFTSSPKISELHELPRPPASSSSQTLRPAGLVGHSAPLVSRAQVHSSSKMGTKSPLPTPPQSIPRSFSIPSSGPRAVDLHTTKPMEGSPGSQTAEDPASPPLSPIAVSNN
ncbi:hypothetical protein UlMin_039938 [Ulmus minor]